MVPPGHLAASITHSPTAEEILKHAFWGLICSHKSLIDHTEQEASVHGDELIVTTSSPYEQAAFGSKTDWRVRAISATNLYLRVNHIYVNPEDIKFTGNRVHLYHDQEYLKFICIADLRTQIPRPQDDPQVKEIRPALFRFLIMGHGTTTLWE
ncbi:hypothetical protein NC651_002099 [Populus alba x Populus x berolinensis]|nr:hypothetical protein NC651_002099 [Populus alba x Populus x berolinensis]